MLYIVKRFLFNIFNYTVSYLVISSLSRIITIMTTVLAALNYTLNSISQPNPTARSQIVAPEAYDFIIVGAGSAGSVIASRLSENEIFKVLLLEAGGEPLSLNSIPTLAPFNLHHPETEWMYKSISQNNSGFANPNNEIPLSRGKSLGGTSNLNFMIYMRGNENDFNNWGTLTGDSQWNYQNVLPYFKKSEDYQGNYPDPEYHGTGGLLTVSSQNYQPLVNEWIDAAKEFGFNSSDPNARQTSTFTPIDATIKNGRRHGTYSAFLEPFLTRKNLKIVSYALVTKINLDNSNKATGVTYVRNGRTITVNANKEVIISAGAFGTPRLLMLSGIGDFQDLQKLGIRPLVDSPGVGKNLQDHVLTLVGPILLNEGASVILDRDIKTNALFEYYSKGTGPLSSNQISGIGLFSTSKPQNPLWPNILTLYSHMGIDQKFPEFIETVFGFPAGHTTEYFSDFLGRDAVFVLLSLGLPASRGTVTLPNADPTAKPLIHLNFFSDSQGKDIREFVEGYKTMVQFFEKTKTWQKYGATILPKAFPGCGDLPLKSDQYYECFIRHFTATIWHPCCTAKMGRIDDPMAVLDSHLRVKKVKGLRVADASVMPVITNANLNAPIIMIGEKVADLIKQDWT